MNWQYKTILFEFKKDGLLGDRYIDDDEMEKILNQQGRQGWELVSVTPVQEGLLSFFKRSLPQAGKQVAVKSAVATESPVRGTASSGRPVSQKVVPRQKNIEKPPVKQAEKLGPRPDQVGKIKIF